MYLIGWKQALHFRDVLLLNNPCLNLFTATTSYIKTLKPNNLFISNLELIEYKAFIHLMTNKPNILNQLLPKTIICEAKQWYLLAKEVGSARISSQD